MISYQRATFSRWKSQVQILLRPFRSNRLRQIREAADKSQQAIADKAGITKQNYQRMESSKANPTVGSLIKVAKAFGKSIGALLEFLRPGK